MNRRENSQNVFTACERKKPLDKWTDSTHGYTIRWKWWVGSLVPEIRAAIFTDTVMLTAWPQLAVVGVKTCAVS